MTAAPIAPVAITGYSLVNALGDDRASVRDALMASRSGLEACPANSKPYAVPFPTVVGKVGVDIPALPPALKAWSSRPAEMAASLVQRLEGPLSAARARFGDARIGLFLGTSTAGADVTEAAYRSYLQTGKMPADYNFETQHAYGAVLHVVQALGGISGPAWMISTTCTSSAKPFGTAQRLIQSGIIDAAVVGGIDTLCSMPLAGFQSLGALSDAPCKPFSQERRGINIGEGGALVLLERDGQAQAWLDGVGESSDAYHISAPHPEGEGAALAMSRALEQAGLSPKDIDHINAHGTGTPHNDIAEGKAIHSLFGADVPVVSTKGYTGHMLGGAGVTEAVLSLLCLEGDFIPESLGAAPLDSRLEIQVNTRLCRQPLSRVLSNSLAFGGNNISLILRKAQ